MDVQFPVIYAVKNTDDLVRNMSSSGGFFYILTKWIIERNGIVFGAKFDQEFKVIHSKAANMDEVIDFLGSKYVQSSLGDCFYEVKVALNSNRLVLFSGTPCQVEGLHSYLGKKYHNLITVDLICHGVPSPKVWKEYLNQISCGRKLKSISFRDKTDGWIDYSMKINYSDGGTYRKSKDDDPFMKGFLADLYLRPSCYECKFRGVKRKSDFTLGDFWGARKHMPFIFDDKGVSLVLIHSKPGLELFKECSEQLVCESVELEVALMSNRSLVLSCKKPHKRDAFFREDIASINVAKRVDELTKKSYVNRLKQSIQSLKVY